jgi:hypothetical protein
MPLRKRIHITRWLNYENSKKIYDNIEIYEDDNLEISLNKIGLLIKSEENKDNLGNFYFWNNLPSFFTIEDVKWKGYDKNPLKSSDRSNNIIKEPIIYNFSNYLSYFNNINVIFENDFPDLKGNPYYFIEGKLNSSLDKLIHKEQKLINLEKKDISSISDNNISIHRYELNSKINSKLLFADIYDKLNTNKLIQYINWINDTYTIIHKLYLYHYIPSYNLNVWTTLGLGEKRSINCYSLLGENSNSYAKISINYDDLSISINYTIDLRKNISWENIQENLIEIKKYLESSLNQTFKIIPISIKAFNYVSISNVSIDNLKKIISSYSDIFKIINASNTINLIYKRSSNYSNEPFDINAYVKNRLLFGVEPNEIIDELLIYNISQEEAKKIIADEIELLNELELQNIKTPIGLNENKLNTIVIIKNTKSGFDITIYNIPNKTELDYLIYWLSKIISSAQQKVKEVKKKAIMVKEKKSSSSSEKKEDDEEDLGKFEFSSSSSHGGNNDKEEQRYRITLLQNADKDLFGENYAREKCQKKFQPFVLSKETRDKLISDNNYHVDNEILYGSKKDKMNYYICPRFWCKESKVPANSETGKCPIEDEERIESFFNKPGEIGIKRFVRLIKPNENDMCVPCCFKKAPKKEDLNKCKNYETYNPLNKQIAIVEEKEENYLVNYPAPIGIGRYGVIPSSLHELLFPEIKFKTCSKELNKTDKCLVRKGINHKEIGKDEDIYPDSFIFALAYTLNFKNKKEFINDIKNKLNLFKFLSLENGNVAKEFMDKLPIIPIENKELIKELNEHLDKFPEIKKLYNVNTNDYNSYKLSRLLAVFKSYKKFIDYISTNYYSPPKTSYYFYSLISSLYNKLMIIWEKQDKITNIICPYFISYNDLIGSMKDINPEVIMFLKDKKYYEPLELKSKNIDGINTFKLNELGKLKELLKSCSNNSDNNYITDDKTYLNLYSLNNWVKTKILKNYEKFLITTIIINSDLSIEHFLTKGGILLTINKIGITFLPRIIEDFNITSLKFYDDIMGKIKINVYIKDLEEFKQKAKINNVKYDLGVLDTSINQNDNDYITEIYTILEIEKKELENLPIIHTRIEDDLYYYNNGNYEENKKWFQLQFMVFSILLKNLDETKLKELQELPRKEYLNKMLEIILENKNKGKGTDKTDNFLNKNNNKIRIILEEVPIYSINHIKFYLDKLNIYYKYDFLNSLININKKRNQFEFSQVALKTMPLELFNYHKSAPNETFLNTKFNTNEFNYKLGQIEKEDINKLPNLFKLGKFEKLESKWTMHKKSFWFNMEILKVKDDYSLDYFKEFFEWFSNYIGLNVDFSSVIQATNDKLKVIRNDETNMKTILNDKSILRCFTQEMKLKGYNTSLTFWNKIYSNLSNQERLTIINSIIKKGLPLNDLHVLSFAELLNISILTIHRAIYGTTKDKDIRGSIEDLLVSTTLFKAPNNYLNRPLLILYKNKDELEDISYHLVLDKRIEIGTKSLYLKLADIPPEILRLIDEHIKIKDKQNQK